MRIPPAAFAGKDVLNVRCPASECGKITTLKKSLPPVPQS